MAIAQFFVDIGQSSCPMGKKICQLIAVMGNVHLANFVLGCAIADIGDDRLLENSKEQIPQVAVYAYGTAITYDKQ